MPFRIIYADITTLKVDAIVNTTDQYYSGGGRGVDYLIHLLCGDDLDMATDKLGRLHLGEAKYTEGFCLPCKYIIHTSGPHWYGRSGYLETSLLGSCYRNSLQVAKLLGCHSIAFPLISSWGKGYPRSLALSIALEAIHEWLEFNDDMEIILAVKGHLNHSIPELLLTNISSLIDESFTPSDDYRTYLNEEVQESKGFDDVEDTVDIVNVIEDLIAKPTQANLDRLKVEETFGEMLSRLIKEKNLKHMDVQDQIAMSNVGFWKIMTGKSNPSKLTVFGIAIALNLTFEELEDMLSKAGYALNPSSVQDIVLSGVFKAGIYDRNTIDDLLDSLALSPLPGCCCD